MRWHTLVLACPAVSAIACAGPQVDIAAETEAVRARSEAIAAAEAAQDVDAALAFWAPDAVAQPAGAPQVEGHDAIRTLYGQFFGTGQLKEFEGTTSHLVVSQGGDLAYEYGVNRMVLTGPDSDLLDVGKYLAVWQKIDGEWYVVALSFTSDAPAPVPIGSD
jgi:ketosteroid isomerase-like protein